MPGTHRVGLRYIPTGRVKPPCWKRISDFPDARRYAVAFSLGNECKGYVGLGSVTSHYWRNDFYVYDPATNKWSQIADFPGNKRGGAVAFTIGDKAYVGTGADESSFYKDFYEYNPDTDVWTQISDLPGWERYNAVGLSADGYGFVGTGFISDPPGPGLLDDWWRYEPATDNWVQKADFPGGPRNAGVGHSAYIGLGPGPGAEPYEWDWWLYDVLTNTWDQKKDLCVPRANAVCFKIGAYFYVGTGRPTGFEGKKDFYRYDVADDHWISITDYPIDVFSAVSFSIGNYGYVGTGGTGTWGRTKEFYRYDPTKQPPHKEADIVTESGDGYVCNRDVVYTTAHDAASGLSMSDNAVSAIFGQYISYGKYVIVRGFLGFDTSSLPAGAHVFRAYVHIYVAGIYNNVDPTDDLCLVQSTQDSVFSLALSDYSKVGDLIIGSIAGGSVVNDAWNDIELDCEGIELINTEGCTKIGLRSKKDIDTNAPPEEKVFYFYCSEKAGYCPVLHVDYCVR